MNVICIESSCVFIEEFTLVSRKLSRGEEVALSSDKITYFQTLRSLDIQWADRTLVDDPTGFGKCMGQLEGCRLGIEPYFYKVSKEDVSFHILGSLHTLTLKILPAFIKEKFESFNCLVNEGRGDPDREETVKKIKEKFSKTAFCWLDRLTPLEKKQFCLMPDCEEISEIIADPDILDIRLLSGMYEQAHFNGMDREIVAMFLAGHKTICGLEGTSSNFLDEILLESPEEALAGLKETLQSDSRNGGFHNDPDRISCRSNYLLGKLGKGHMTFNADPVLEQENKRWFSCLKSIVEGTKSGVGVVVGLAHVIDLNQHSKGLLGYFSDEGWAVQRYDRYGNLTPYPAPK